MADSRSPSAASAPTQPAAAPAAATTRERVARRLIDWLPAFWAVVALAAIIIVASMGLAHFRNRNAAPVNAFNGAVADLMTVPDSLCPGGAESWVRRWTIIREEAGHGRLDPDRFGRFFAVYTPAAVDGRFSPREVSTLDKWLSETESRLSTTARRLE